MKTNTLVVSVLLTSVIIAGAPGSFAGSQYLTNLSAVYGGGSCGTCHVIASGGGQRDFNGTLGQHNSNGTYIPRNRTNRTPRNGTFGMRNSNRTFPLNSYGTLFESLPDHATDPSAALIAIGQPPAATATPDSSADTAVTGTKATPGFEFMLSLVGLFACALLARRHNK